VLIGVDASRAVIAQRTGTEVYSLHLIRALLRLGTDHRFRLYFTTAPSTGLFPDVPHCEQHIIPFPRLWTHLRLSAEMLFRPPDVLLVPSLGAELYTGSYSFAAFRAIVDPRPQAGMTFVLSNRLSTRTAFIEAMLIPRTDGVLNWSLRGRWRWFHAGYSYEQDFDYSRIDREVWTFGLQVDLEPDDLGS